MAFNILLVDDSDVIRAMIRRTLELAQVDVGTLHEASNGREALDVLAEEWVDLVLADINMPVMNGAEMIRTMRQCDETVDVPVIVVSTEGATERVDELTALGVSAWVRKPFTPEEIRNVIQQVTTGWRAPIETGEVDEIFGSVLETFAYVFPEPADLTELPDTGDELICATIMFSGAASGTMSLTAPSSLCADLAANIMGIEADDFDATMRGADTLGEIVNIAAGHLATRVDPDRPTHLHPPVVERILREGWQRKLGADTTRAYLVEDQPVLVSVGLRRTGVN